MHILTNDIVEAAARAIMKAEIGTDAARDAFDREYLESTKHLARAALEAALPMIVERVQKHETPPHDSARQGS